MLYDGVQIKASGGIASFKDAITYINLGAARIGTSNTVAILENADEHELKQNKLSLEAFASLFDHTNLDSQATEEEIQTTIKDAITYNCKSVCVRPEFLELAYHLIKTIKTLRKNTPLRICVVIGFENLIEKDNGSLGFERYNISIEDKKAELDKIFSIIKIE